MDRQGGQRRLRITAVFAAAALALSGAAAADMGGGPDKQPKRPTGLNVTATATSLTLSWNLVDNAAGYGVYIDKAAAGTTTATSWTFSNLKCGTTHGLAVDTISSSGGHSEKASMSGTTDPCQGNPPVVSSFSPTSGPIGTGVTISGSNFTGATSVTFNGTSATFTVNGDSQITTTVPSAATTGPIAVTTPNGTGSSNSSFTVSSSPPGPAISSFSPVSGPVGTSVTISGSNFTGATSVTFNAAAATFTVNSSSQITTTVPSAATTGPIAVTTPGGTATSATSFTVTTSPPPPGPGNVFVAPPSSAGLGTSGSDSDGTNCTRFGAAVAAPPGGVGYGCASFQKAYKLAQPGDTVFLNWNGAWPITLGIGPAGNKTSANGCNYPSDISGCINFTPAPGLTPSLTPSGTTTPALKICANYIELSNVTFNQRTYVDGFGDTVTTGTWGVGHGDNSCLPSGAPPHDVFIKNVISNGQAEVVGGSSNVYVLGGAIQNTRDLVPQFGGRGNNGATTGVHNNTIDGVTFTNEYGDDAAHHHMECLHLDNGADSVTVKDSSFVGCKAGPAGPVYSIRFETDVTGSAATNNLVENNVIDQSAPISFNCHANNCAVTGNTVRFNTITGSGSSLIFANDCARVGGQTCTVSGNQFYGNIVRGGCPSNSTINAAGWSETYNVWSGGGGAGTICKGDTTSAYNATISLTSPNDRLANCTQAAGNLIPPMNIPGLPPTDIVGNSRPQSNAVDAGANEDC